MRDTYSVGQMGAGRNPARPLVIPLLRYLGAGLRAAAITRTISTFRTRVASSLRKLKKRLSTRRVLTVAGRLMIPPSRKWIRAPTPMAAPDMRLRSKTLATACSKLAFPMKTLLPSVPRIMTNGKAGRTSCNQSKCCVWSTSGDIADSTLWWRASSLIPLSIT